MFFHACISSAWSACEIAARKTFLLRVAAIRQLTKERVEKMYHVTSLCRILSKHFSKYAAPRAMRWKKTQRPTLSHCACTSPRRYQTNSSTVCVERTSLALYVRVSAPPALKMPIDRPARLLCDFVVFFADIVAAAIC